MIDPSNWLLEEQEAWVVFYYIYLAVKKESEDDESKS